MKFNAALAGLAVLLAMGGAIGADYPERPVTIVVPFAAGGTVDGPMRILAQRLSEQTGKTFIVQNRPGAGGAMATQAVAGSPGDGYLLLASTSSMPITQALYRQAGFDSVGSFQHLAMVATTPTVLVVGGRVKARNLQELVAELKARPGALSYGSPGSGTGSHLAAELLKQHLGVDMLHVPYKGAAPALNDLLGGQIDVLIAGLSASSALIQQGTLRALAVTTHERHPLLPTVPTVDELYPGFSYLPWIGLSAPATTPAPVARWLSEQVRLALEHPGVRQRFTQIGADPAYAAPTDFSRRVGSETVLYAQVVQRAGLQAD